MPRHPLVNVAPSLLTRNRWDENFLVNPITTSVNHSKQHSWWYMKCIEMVWPYDPNLWNSPHDLHKAMQRYEPTLLPHFSTSLALKELALYFGSQNVLFLSFSMEMSTVAVDFSVFKCNGWAGHLVARPKRCWRSRLSPWRCVGPSKSAPTRRSSRLSAGSPWASRPAKSGSHRCGPRRRNPDFRWMGPKKRFQKMKRSRTWNKINQKL